MKSWRLILLLLLGMNSLLAIADTGYKYRVWLTDKPTGEFSIENPSAFLSQKSIERRNRHGIAIEESDLPVSQRYINEIARCGVTPVVTSRWLNTVVVAMTDTTILPTIKALPYVKKVERVWQAISATSKKLAKKREIEITTPSSEYGLSYEQLAMLGIDSLHYQGYRGEGMTIAVLDGGFYHVDRNPTIDTNRIVGTHDYPLGTFSYNSDLHGAYVLSCLLSQDKGRYIGSAPAADYWLIITEDTRSEYPVEEDYWVAGVEFADSVGADIISSSLGYNQFDDTALNYTQTDLDGATAFSSRGAAIAATKGLLVVSAAGNEGTSAWKKINVPSDAEGILAVGAVDPSGTRADFSSLGNTADGRIKPDVMAVGRGTCMTIEEHVVISSNGTSFATPIMSGGVACLWQAHPEWSVEQLITAVKASGSHTQKPDEYMGYGIPNLYKALHYNSSVNTIKQDATQSLVVHTGLLRLLHPATKTTIVSLYDITGIEVLSAVLHAGECDIVTNNIPSGVYIALLECDTRQHVQKIVVK